MTPSRVPIPGPPLLAGLILLATAACGRNGQRELVQAAEEHAAEEQPRPRPGPERNGEPPEIFYDLTRYDWYRHGEPLLVDGRALQPAGRPEPARGREFMPIDRFHGVAYYAVEGADPPYAAVYVPVSPGYWQPFAEQPAAAPAEEEPA